MERMKTVPCAYEAIITLKGGAEMRVSVVSGAPGRRMQFTILSRGQTIEVARLIERDDLWYLSEDGKNRKYRALEAPFTLSSMPVLRERADVLVVSNPELVGKFEGLDSAGVASYRSPAPAALAQQASSMLREYETMLKDKRQQPSPEHKEKLDKTMAGFRELLERGVLLRVDAASGIIIEMGSQNLPVRIEKFRWLDAAPARELAVEGTKWENLADDPTEGSDLSELV